MGRLFVSAEIPPLVVDDRTLAHLQIVMLRKLAAHEGFSLSWPEPLAAGGGRSVAWVHPSMRLHFRFDGGSRFSIDPRWIQVLTETANSPGGLRLVADPGAGDATEPRGVAEPRG